MQKRLMYKSFIVMMPLLLIILLLYYILKDPPDYTYGLIRTINCTTNTQMVQIETVDLQMIMRAWLNYDYKGAGLDAVPRGWSKVKIWLPSFNKNFDGYIAPNNCLIKIYDNEVFCTRSCITNEAVREGDKYRNLDHSDCPPLDSYDRSC